MSFLRPIALPFVLTLSLGSCMSYTTSRPLALDDTPESWEKLPYHVAVIPVDGSEVFPIDVTRDGAELNYAFQKGSLVDGQDLITSNLAGVLSENVFSRVTVLPAPSADQYNSFEQGGLDAYWMAAAREVKADLLLDVDSLNYPTQPKSSGLLQSYLLFFAGPLELMFADRKYSFDDMSLAVSLYDVGKLASRSTSFRGDSVDALVNVVSEGASSEPETMAGKEWESAQDFRLADGGIVRQFRLQPEDLHVRFGDRFGKGPGSPGFWTTLVVPSAFLQRDSDAFKERLSIDASVALAQDLAREIFEGDVAFIVEPQSSQDALHLDATLASLAPSELLGGGVIELRAPYKKPSNALGRSKVRVGAFEFEIGVLGGPNPSKDEIREALDRGWAAAVVRKNTFSESRLPDELVLYIPTNVAGMTPASFSPRAPVEVVQLTLAEDRASRGEVLQSWTFELAGAVDEGRITTIREASFKGQNVAPIEASAKRASSAIAPLQEAQ